MTASDLYQCETSCRLCGADGLEMIHDFGVTPLADRLLRAEQLQQLTLRPEPRVPLTLHLCARCSLVQIAETVRPDILFGEHYPYYSSVSAALLAHFAASAHELLNAGWLSADSLVVEAASNDGYLLRHFYAAGLQVLGIDPAAGPVAVARAAGIETLQSFFDLPLALELRAQYPRGADLFLANNVLAHVADLNGFVAGIAALLSERGRAVLEVPYLADLLDHAEFDTIYHQHLCYFSVTALQALFARHGLCLQRVQRTPIHGGSLRLTVGHGADSDASVAALLKAEQVRGVRDINSYRRFTAQVADIREALLGTLGALTAEGKTVAGYGAAAKACTLMSYCGIDRQMLPFIIDSNVHKHGRYMPGNHIPVVSCDRLRQDPPDYLLILAWNFADEIMQQQAAYRAQGGHFIIPVPELRVC